MTQFRNLQELITKLSDDKVCRDYFENMRWQGILFVLIVVLLNHTD